MAITAHALAVRSGKGVIHFFDPSSFTHDDPISAEDSALVGKILNLDDVRRYQSTSAAASGIYAKDGRVAIVSEQPETRSTPGVSSLTDSAILAANSKATSSQVSEKSSQQNDSSASPSVSEATTIESSAPHVASEDI
jgi:sulfite reductase (NADPH) hemoprotein beta-component